MRHLALAPALAAFFRESCARKDSAGRADARPGRRRRICACISSGRRRRGRGARRTQERERAQGRPWRPRTQKTRPAASTRLRVGGCEATLRSGGAEEAEGGGKGKLRSHARPSCSPSLKSHLRGKLKLRKRKVAQRRRVCSVARAEGLREGTRERQVVARDGAKAGSASVASPLCVSGGPRPRLRLRLSSRLCLNDDHNVAAQPGARASGSKGKSSTVAVASAVTIAIVAIVVVVALSLSLKRGLAILTQAAQCAQDAPADGASTLRYSNSRGKRGNADRPGDGGGGTNEERPGRSQEPVVQEGGPELQQQRRVNALADINLRPCRRSSRCPDAGLGVRTGARAGSGSR